jgi:hypothetical protein
MNIEGKSQMTRRIRALLYVTVLLTLTTSCASTQAISVPQPPHTALLNGYWFNGESFETRDVYSVDGRLTFRKPARVDRTLDLTGMWVVPPFGEAHNHNINGIEERDRQVIQKYLSDGVFYVRIPGNLPLSDEVKRRLPLNRPDGVDALFSQGAMLTAAGGHPRMLADLVWLRPGYFPGHTSETLEDHRYFTIDSEADIENKWPRIIGQRPDFIKIILWNSDEFEERKGNPAYYGRYGLDPRLLPGVVAKARADRLRVAAHVSDASDFRRAVAAGVDEITHIPLTPIAVEDARLAADRGIVVDTTYAAMSSLPPMILPSDERPQALAALLANLKLLHQNGVTLRIGSDNVNDSSAAELEHLQALGVFDNLTLLKLWAETTPKSIFPGRKIGALREGYEASFLALEGNPLEDLENLRAIRMRFKQGYPLELE